MRPRLQPWKHPVNNFCRLVFIWGPTGALLSSEGSVLPKYARRKASRSSLTKVWRPLVRPVVETPHPATGQPPSGEVRCGQASGDTISVASSSSRSGTLDETICRDTAAQEEYELSKSLPFCGCYGSASRAIITAGL